MDEDTRAALAAAMRRIEVLDGLVDMLIAQTRTTDLSARHYHRKRLEGLRDALAPGDPDLARIEGQLARIPAG
jgi:hypothetical protein